MYLLVQLMNVPLLDTERFSEREGPNPSHSEKHSVSLFHHAGVVQVGLHTPSRSS